MSKSNLVFAKLDPGFFNNRKIRRAGRNGRDVYLYVLCQNAARGGKGWIPIGEIEDVEHVAEQTQLTEAEVRDGIARACNAGLVTCNGTLVMINGWDEDWARRAATNAERQADWRKRNSSSNDSSVTRNGKITRNGSEERRGEEREARVTREDSLSGVSDSEQSEQSQESAADRAGRGARSRRQHELPADWKPTPAAIDLAQSLGLDVQHEAQQFRLDAKQHGKTFADHDAAFEKFFRGSRDVGRARPKVLAPSRKPRRSRLEDGRVVELDDDGEITRVIPEGDQR